MRLYPRTCAKPNADFWGPFNTLRSLRHEDAWLHCQHGTESSIKVCETHNISSFYIHPNHQSTNCPYHCTDGFTTKERTEGATLRWIADTGRKKIIGQCIRALGNKRIISSTFMECHALMHAEPICCAPRRHGQAQIKEDTLQLPHTCSRTRAFQAAFQMHLQSRALRTPWLQGATGAWGCSSYCHGHCPVRSHRHCVVASGPSLPCLGMRAQHISGVQNTEWGAL